MDAHEARIALKDVLSLLLDDEENEELLEVHSSAFSPPL